MSKLKFKRLLGAVAIAGSLAFAGGAATEVKAEGGTFVWGMSSEMSILDPHVACGWLTTNAIHSIFEGLVMLDLSDPDAKSAPLKPAIAKSWEVNEDGTVYTFAIRENVRFHDGTAVDADVVKWNYDRFMDSGAEHAFDQAQAYLGYYTRWIKSVEVTGPMSVKITLNETNYEWLQMGVVACGMPMIASPTAIQEMGNEQFALTPVGTGPFKFIEREQNIKLVMDRNEDYWGENAKIERLIFQPLPDQATRLNAIRAGEVSMIMEAPWEELENLKNEGFTVTINENIPSIWLLFFNHKNPIMQDVRVRKAINMAIDRDAIADGILKGTGRPEMGMLSPGTYAYKPGYAPVKYDPEGAKALLAEAGYPDGLDLDFDIYEYGYNEVWEKSIQRDLKKVGVNAKLNKIEWITYMGKFLKGMPEELHMNEIGWGWTIPFWTQVMTRCDYHPPNGFNVGWYCNPEVDKLFDEAVKQKDKAKAAALYQQANDIIIGQDFGYAVKFTYKNPLVLSPSVKHFVNPPANWYDFSIIELE